MEALRTDAESHGAQYVFHCTVNSVEVSAQHDASTAVTESIQNKFQLRTSQGDVHSDYLVNAAGLYAPYLAHNIKPETSTMPFTLFTASLPNYCCFAKGSYFRLESGVSPFKRLVYPVPATNAGLGIHATIDLQGRVRFGPDVEWLLSHEDSSRNLNVEGFEHLFSCDKRLPQFDYNVDINRSESFKSAICRYWPEVEFHDLVPDYSGIRPKLVGPQGHPDGEHSTREWSDFIIHGARQHGISGLVNLYGIESPGLTSSLAIAEYVQSQLLMSTS